MEKGENNKGKAIFAISSLGLGHAARTLPIIRYFLSENYHITVVSCGNALAFLKNELSRERNIDFISRKDYPPLERGGGLRFYCYLIGDSLKARMMIRKENKFLKKIAEGVDFIFSDGKYGFYSPKIPSFILTHQVSFLIPSRVKIFRLVVDYFNYKCLKKFDLLLIPDFADKNMNLSGELAHTAFLRKLKHKFIGILSAYRNLNIADDIDYLFLISGYLLEHKDKFISKLIGEAKKVEGKKVFVLGDTSKHCITKVKNNDITIYSYAAGKLRENLFNRAKVIISRTGYTTIMDLVELGKRAILFPTPHQREQEYLAEYLEGRGCYVIGKDQNNFSLADLIGRVKQGGLIGSELKTADTLKLLGGEIRKLIKKNFFSIIIPAYNEEKYIGETLKGIKNFNYDKNNFEVIVVESGSSDRTYAVAENFKSKGFRLRIYKSRRGVSVARNLGRSKISPRSDWVIFLDADTLLKRNFLSELNNFLNKNADKNFVVGTTAVWPHKDDSGKAKYWFKFYNLGHRLTKTSFSIQIVKREIAENVSYDEKLRFSEDLKYIKDAKKLGNFFFWNTDNVLTSTRRFKEVGYTKLFFEWNLEAFLPRKLKEMKNYKAIR